MRDAHNILYEKFQTFKITVELCFHEIDRLLFELNRLKSFTINLSLEYKNKLLEIFEKYYIVKNFEGFVSSSNNIVFSFYPYKFTKYGAINPIISFDVNFTSATIEEYNITKYIYLTIRHISGKEKCKILVYFLKNTCIIDLENFKNKIIRYFDKIPFYLIPMGKDDTILCKRTYYAEHYLI